MSLVCLVKDVQTNFTDLIAKLLSSVILVEQLQIGQCQCGHCQAIGKLTVNVNGDSKVTATV